MISIKKYSALLLLFLVPALCHAQTNTIDKLQARLQQATTPTERLDGILALCEEHHSLNRDTLYNLALEAKMLAASQPGNDKKRLAAIALSNAYMKWGWADSALDAMEPVLKEEKGDNKSIYYKMLREQAIIYGGKNNLEKGLAILFPALTAAESSKDTLNMAAIMNSIGSMKMASQLYDEALTWIWKAARLCTNNPACKNTQAAIYTNAANAYMQKNMFDSCLLYIERAIVLSRETEDLLILATALRIKSSVLTTQKKFAEAETTIKEMIETRYRSQGSNLFIEDNLQLADFYANTGQLEKAIQLCKQMLQTGNLYDTAFRLPVIFTNSPQLRLEYWQALARYYKQGNRQPEYQQALEQVVMLKDSVYTTNSERAIADAETKYEVQKKENTILQQKYSLREGRFLLFGLLGLMIMALLVAYFILRDYRRKQKIKMELAMADERAKAADAVKVAEEKERVRIAADLHDNIGAYASAIKSDVEKMAMGASGTENPQLQSLQHHSQEIINSLRDTIWVLNKEHITITGISDRIKNYISKLQASYEQVQFNINETITADIRISSPTALNIFRIVQEAVHNALKHSGATEVNIAIASTNNVAISIADNGKGMDVSLQNGKGNGLSNMKARAAEAGLHLTIKSIINEGTTVAMQLPTIN